jgi:peptidyl-tRNA hydrolase
MLLSPWYELTAGKEMAQAAHAAQLGWRASSPADRESWRAAGFPLAVRRADAKQWKSALQQGAPVVHDAGFTEVAADTQTALAVLPWLGLGP